MIYYCSKYRFQTRALLSCTSSSRLQSGRFFKTLPFIITSLLYILYIKISLRHRLITSEFYITEEVDQWYGWDIDLGLWAGTWDTGMVNLRLQRGHYKTKQLDTHWRSKTQQDRWTLWQPGNLLSVGFAERWTHQGPCDVPLSRRCHLHIAGQMILK